MDAATRNAVRISADNRCEYCLLRQKHSPRPHHVEHIIAKQHDGSDNLDNLALACHRCNGSKGPNLTGVDPITGGIVPLFHPRRDTWTEHFQRRGERIEGITPVGRATVQVLAMNEKRRLGLRFELLVRGQL